MSDAPLYLLAVLGLTVALSEWLVRRTFLRHLGSALLVILLTAVWANLGWIPTGRDPPPLYDGIFSVVAPLSIFLLLLDVSLADVRRAGAPMLGLFALGAVGTFAGVMLGMTVVGGEQAFGASHDALGGMFVGTYTGGSLNFNLIANHYGVTREGALYTGAMAIDSIMTAVWMVVTIVLPRRLRRRKGARVAAIAEPTGEQVADDGGGRSAHDAETTSPLELGLVLALGAGAQWLSTEWAAVLGGWLGVRVPSVLVLTTLALVLAQVPAIRRIRGTRLVGMFGVYLFLSVIGAYCDLAAFEGMGQLGPDMLLFVCTILGVHGLVVFGGTSLLRADGDMAAIASQANIGGGTTALALARSLGRGDLVLPAILVGSVGTASGTYLGFFAAGLLGRSG